MLVIYTGANGIVDRAEAEPRVSNRRVVIIADEPPTTQRYRAADVVGYTESAVISPVASGHLAERLLVLSTAAACDKVIFGRISEGCRITSRNGKDRRLTTIVAAAAAAAKENAPTPAVASDVITAWPYDLTPPPPPPPPRGLKSSPQAT